MPTSLSHTRKVNLVRQDTPKQLSIFYRLLLFFVSKSRVESIQKGMKQAKQIHEGKIEAKSFEESITEL
jgi:hypothetical protein